MMVYIEYNTALVATYVVLVSTSNTDTEEMCLVAFYTVMQLMPCGECLLVGRYSACASSPESRAVCLVMFASLHYLSLLRCQAA